MIFSQVPKAEFKVLLRYIKELKGNQRQLTLTRAQTILSQRDGSSDGDTTSRNKRIHKRARAVLRALS